MRLCNSKENWVPCCVTRCTNNLSCSAYSSLLLCIIQVKHRFRASTSLDRSAALASNCSAASWPMSARNSGTSETEPVSDIFYNDSGVFPLCYEEQCIHTPQKGYNLRYRSESTETPERCEGNGHFWFVVVIRVMLWKLSMQLLSQCLYVKILRGKR